MEAHELRIGNYFIEKYTKEYIKVIELTELGITFSGKFINVWCADPIMLTEEILLKCGFKKYISDGVVGMDTYEQEEKTIWYQLKGFTTVQLGENTDYFYSNNNLHVLLISLHQLQNLYFALTGIELIVNL